MAVSMSAAKVPIELYEKARSLLVLKQQVSGSTLQLNFLLGYADALRLMDELEKTGVVTEPDENGLRTLTPGYQCEPI